MEERQNFNIQMKNNEEQQECSQHLYLIERMATY